MKNFPPDQILKKFDDFLQEKKLQYRDGVVVGGAAIAILYRKTRVTQDIDVLTPIPQPIKSASREFAVKEGLSPEWLNNRVVNLDNCKPAGWGVDLLELYDGVNLSLYSISRENLLRTKVFSFCDRSEGLAIDFPDIEAMKPTTSELNEACDWAMKELKRQKGSKKEIEFFKAAISSLKKMIH